MAIFELEETSTQGIQKNIDKDSRAVALDILQRGIYMFPVPSTIRELASNAYDAINERDVAKSILNGESKIEEHFDTDKVDGIYHASGWDPSYFDIAHLSADPNVYIYYDEGIQKDTLRIKDFGVGIGKDRMVGYFQLAWSSKRSQKGALGKFGLGSKVALSLGLDSFTVISVYNGKKFRFEVYLDNIISTIPKFSNGKLNEGLIVSVPQENADGNKIVKDFQFLYEDTTEKNGLEVVIPVKKHNKKAFFEAVEAQLLYVPNIIFNHKGKNDLNYIQKDIAAKIVYQDSSIVISESTVFNKPHILLGAGKGLINYGVIAFNELELEPKNGAVGLIMDINDVEVTPSRESVIWSAKTRKAIIKSYGDVVKTATDMVNKELQTEIDYYSWIRKAASIKNALVSNSSGSNNSTIQKLAGIIDASAVNDIKFTKGKFSTKFVSDVKHMIGDHLLIRTFNYDSYARKVLRTKIKTVNTLANYQHVYITDGASDKYKDRYIFDTLASGIFVVVKKLAGWNLEHTSNLIGNSTALESYDAVVVPQDVMDNYLAEELNKGIMDDEESESVTIDTNQAAKLRKLEEKILYHQAYVAQPISYSSAEIKIMDIESHFKGQTVVYGTFNDRDIINSVLGMFAPMMCSFIGKGNLEYGGKSVVVELIQGVMSANDIKPINAILISKDVEKHFVKRSNFINIADFIVESYVDGTVVFNKAIRLAATFQLMRPALSDLVMLQNNAFEHEGFSNLYMSEFGNVLKLWSAFKNSPSRHMAPFIQNCINYESRKETADINDLKSYLDYIDTNLPDALCTIVDEISDVRIIEKDLLNKVTEYATHFKYFNDILETMHYVSSTQITALAELIHNFKTIPLPINQFHLNEDYKSAD